MKSAFMPSLNRGQSSSLSLSLVDNTPDVLLLWVWAHSKISNTGARERKWVTNKPLQSDSGAVRKAVWIERTDLPGYSGDTNSNKEIGTRPRPALEHLMAVLNSRWVRTGSKCRSRGVTWSVLRLRTTFLGHYSELFGACQGVRKISKQK